MLERLTEIMISSEKSWQPVDNFVTVVFKDLRSEKQKRHPGSSDFANNNTVEKSRKKINRTEELEIAMPIPK